MSSAICHITASNVQEIADYKYPAHHVSVEEWNLTPVGEDTLGFLGRAARLQVKVRVGDKVHTIRGFIKYAPLDNKAHYDVVDYMQVYLKEPNIYKLLGEMRAFLSEPVAPDMYLGKTNEYLVLEDLCHEGFTTIPNAQTYDLAHCEVALRTLGRLHAASVLYERAKGARIDELIPNNLFEVLYNTDPKHPGTKWTVAGRQMVREIIAMFFQNVGREVVEDAIQLIADLSTSTKQTAYPKVLSHCDMWNNNVMFRYKDGKPDACRLVDFQLARYYSPAFDVLHLLYTNTTRELRNNHYQHLLSHYYQTFAHELKARGVDPNSFISWTDFQGAAAEFRPKAIAISNLYLHFILIPGETLKSIVKSQEDYDQFWCYERLNKLKPLLENDKEYFKRVYEAAQELIEYVKDKRSK